jgi:competence ComEA-like helix-hairpin-helix protein
MKKAYNGAFDKCGSKQRKCESYPFIISILICALLTSLFVVPYLTRAFEKNENVLADGINPNNASTASLARLPGVGIVRAEAIVAYSKEFTSSDSNQVFENCKDLEKVRGIGPTTAQKICEWLKFE